MAPKLWNTPNCAASPRWFAPPPCAKNADWTSKHFRRQALAPRVLTQTKRGKEGALTPTLGRKRSAFGVKSLEHFASQLIAGRGGDCETPSSPTSIPAKAGISFSRQREFSAKRNGRLSANAAVAAEIPAFAGMEGGGIFPGGISPRNKLRGKISQRAILSNSLGCLKRQ